MPGLIGLVITLVILVVVLWLVFWVLGQFPLGEPFDRIVRVIAVIIAVIILIYVLASLAGYAPPLRVGRYGAAPFPALRWG